MANKLISHMGLPASIANVFAARSILTAKDALSLPEFELMTLLDVGIDQVMAAVVRISEVTCPPYQTALSLMEDRARSGGWLPTLLRGLDGALGGGIPFRALTELVGPSGIGKTQFCLKLSLLAALPACYGGLNGRVVYIDTESKFSSRRMIEIGQNSFRQLFQSEGMAQEMAGRIVVVRPTSLSDFTDRLQQVKLTIIQHDVKLLVVDSMAALASGENERSTTGPKHNSLRWHVSFLKSLAEFAQIPIVVTNQVRSQNNDEAFQYSFQGREKDTSKNSERLESHLIAALGTQWAHAVTIRLIFEAHSGCIRTDLKIHVINKLNKEEVQTDDIHSMNVWFADTCNVYLSSVYANTFIGMVSNCGSFGNLIHATNAGAGQRFIKVAKSPMSPAVSFPFIVEPSGILLLGDEGIQVMGPEINTIRCQGHSKLDQ